jgi:hypothetical protein
MKHRIVLAILLGVFYPLLLMHKSLTVPIV